MNPFPPADEECFIDANILHAHIENLGNISTYATAFFREILSGSRAAATNAGAIADAVHKIMLSEAGTKFNRPRAGLLSWLQNHQDKIQQLSLFKQAADEFALIPFRILLVSPTIICEAADLAQRHGLLTNDAVIVAQMQRHGIHHLVSNDSDFAAIPTITLWPPG